MLRGTADRRPAMVLMLAVGVMVAFGPGVAGALGSQDPTPPMPSALTESAPTEAPPGDSVSTTSAPTNGAAVVTTLLVDGKPLKGVTVVAARDRRKVASDTSDATGAVRIELDEPGQYEVSIDKGTLPDGVEAVPGALTKLTPIVRDGATSPVVFQLQKAGSEVSGGESSFTRVLGLIFSGLRFGLVIAMAAVGLSLIFGTTGLTNFAHGEIVAFGALITWAINSGFGIPLFAAAVVGTVATAIFGGVLEVGLFRPLRHRGMPDLSVMVVSIGLAFVLRYGFAIIFGAGPKQFVQFAAQAPTIDLGPISVRPKDLVIVAIGIVVLVAVGLFLQRSRLGTAIRAVSDDRDLSESSGIDVQRVILTVWVLSGALAGLGGILLAATETASWNMGQRALLVMFAAVVLGGLGTAYGAMAGGLLVGIVSDLSTYWLDADLKIVVALGALIIVLLVRPTGIFGVRARAA